MNTLTYPTIFRFWAPLSVQWLMISLEGPMLAAVIARLADPEINLAAYGVVIALGLLLEAPVIMMLSAATALVRGPNTLAVLRKFSARLNLIVTAVIVVVALPPVFAPIGEHLLNLPPEVAVLAGQGLLLMAPWPGAIGYRRFHQGLLISAGKTRLVAYGTVLRIAGMLGVSLGLAVFTDVPGAWVGAAGLSGGVTVEAVVAGLMARSLKKDLAAMPADDEAISMGEVWTFYYPLALTSFVALAAHPVVTFFMGHGLRPVESLAVLPVVNALVFIFRGVGLSYQEVAIALMGRKFEEYDRVMRFGKMLAGGAVALLGLIAFTPLADVWFVTVSGLPPALAELARQPLFILFAMPGFSVWLSMQRATMVTARKTGFVSRATAMELLGIVVILGVMINTVPVPGVTLAAVAYMASRLIANGYLFFKARAAVRRVRHG